MLATTEGYGTFEIMRRGDYLSHDYRERAIYDYLLRHNAKPKPFIWNKGRADDILTPERGALDALEAVRRNIEPHNPQVPR